MDTKQYRGRVAFLSQKVDELRRVEQTLPYERDDWRKVSRELQRVEGMLAQARRDLELSEEWDAVDFSIFGDTPDVPLTPEQEASLQEHLADEAARTQRAREAERRRRAFRVIDGGVRHRP